MSKFPRSVFLAWLLKPHAIAAKRFLHETIRRLTFKKRVVSVFLQLDDPYSYLLGHYLAGVIKRYQRVEFKFYLCQSLRGDYTPEPALLAEYAITDCRLLAAEFGVPFLDQGDTPVVEFRRPLLEYLAAEQAEDDFGTTFIAALTQYWRGDTAGVTRMMGRTYGESAETNILIGKNQLLLRKLGHYNSAMMHYAGDWYWGVDRLGHLLERFNAQGLDRFKEPLPELTSLERAMQINFPVTVPERAEKLPALELFYSFRSPYSYLVLREAFLLADSFGLKLVVRPVLPMATRGMKIPRNKLLYILKDANREARHKEISFGNICDPLGVGVERCMAAFYYAVEQNRERDFLLAVGNAIFAQAVDVATDEGMQVVADKAGLFWPELQAALDNDDWREKAQNNRDNLRETGLWGVPVLKLGEQAFWGQDRAWLLARKVEDLCQGGEGIMI